MGVTERRAREKEALRQSILDAAGALIVEEGYQNLSIRKLAERIEYSPSTIYLYFKDKAEIMASICIDAFSELGEQLEEVRGRTANDPLAGLREGLGCYLRWGLSHPNHYMVTFGTPWPKQEEGAHCADTEALEGSISAGLECFHRLGDVIERCIAAGQIPPGNVNLMTQVAWTSVHGLASCLIVMKDDPHFPWEPTERLIEGMVANVVAGLQSGAVAAAVAATTRESQPALQGQAQHPGPF